MRYHILYVSVIMVLLLYLIFGNNGLLQYRELLSIQKSYEVQSKELKQKVKQLESELILLKKDTAYTEMMIKKEINLKKPKEDLYIIDNESSKRITNHPEN